MNDNFDKIKFSKLTKSQKAKADRIMELIRRLQDEDVHTFAVSSPTDYLCFVRCDETSGIDGSNYNDIPKESEYCNLNSSGLVTGIAL